MVLQRFPLRHQVADFPHQRLMAIDDRLRSCGILIKPRFRHRRFQLLHFGFARRDARLEIGDALPQRLLVALLLLPLRLEPLPLFAILLPGGGLSLFRRLSLSLQP